MSKNSSEKPKSSAPSFPWQTVGPFLWLTLTIAYCVVFFAAPMAESADRPTFYRGALLLLFFRPDDLMQQWVGYDLSQFAILDRLPILLLATSILIAASAAGWLALKAGGVSKRLTRLETVVFSAGAGLNLASLWALIVGWSGGLHNPLWFIVPGAAVIATAGWQWWRNERWSFAPRMSARLRSERPRPRQTEANVRSPSGETEKPHTWWLSKHGLWLATPFVAILLLGAMLPPSHFDVREYHLQAPKEWQQAGSIHFLPHNVYAQMPLGAEMHALITMCLAPGERGWWWGALAGKTVIAMMTIVTALALVACGRRFFSPAAGVVAGLVYLSFPWVIGVSHQGLVEGAVGMYLFLAGYMTMIWWSQGASDLSLAGAAGFLAGGAVACKYPALLFVAAPLCLAIFAARLQLNVKATVVYLMLLLCGCGLWFAKNWAQTGNPTYPLLYSVFGGETRTSEKDTQWREGHAVPVDDQGRAYTMTQLVNAFKQALWRSPWHSLLVIPFAAMAFVRPAWRRWSAGLLAFFLFFFLTWWLATHRIDRFWIPAVPLLAMLAGAGAVWGHSRPWRVIMASFLCFGLAVNLLLASSIILGDNRFFVSLESLRVDLPRDEVSFTRVNSAHRFLNQATPPGWKALLVGDAQAFDLEVPVLYNTCFDDCWFETLFKGRTAEEQLRELHERKIAYVFIHWSEIKRYRETYGYSDYVTPKRVREMVRQGVLLPPITTTGADVWETGEGEYPPPQIFPVAKVDAIRQPPGR